MNRIQQPTLQQLAQRCSSPYSGIKVVCRLHTPNGVHDGVNVESASYGLTICAERNAIFSAISNGVDPETIDRVTIGSSLVGITPCGACAQIMSEFLLPETVVECGDLDGKIGRRFMVRDMLPHRFALE